ncbi:hypothetical protein [Methanomethylophilus alvi]|uniref:hypothetical protein n=1 Tax=Methanomethylophilus alvi TaxID=1291540 RepID=UPI0037DC5066
MNWKFTLFAVLVMVSVSAYAVISECSDGSEAASDDSGSCGHNVTYVFDSSTGTLTISGSGGIYSSGGAPWYPYRSDVKKVVIEDGITDIGRRSDYMTPGSSQGTASGLLSRIALSTMHYLHMCQMPIVP